MNDLSRNELEAEIEMLQGEAKELRSALESAYVMLDRFSADMTDEAYHEVEAVLGNALEDDFPAQSRLQKLAADLAGEKERRQELEVEKERLREALRQIALRKSGFVIPPVSPADSDASWHDAIRVLRQYARDVLDQKPPLDPGVNHADTTEATPGDWFVEEQDDGSWWVMGPDPKDKSEMVLIAACEMEDDAHHIARLHNALDGGGPGDA